MLYQLYDTYAKVSLSARRAWIEIDGTVSGSGDYVVALRKESVDRNTNFSPASLFGLVALRKESVDRNKPFSCFLVGCVGRSPQGERG